MQKVTTILIAITIVIGTWVLTTKYTEPFRVQNVIEETVEVTPTEEELRRIEWEKEAEAVKAQHLKKKELEYERSILLQEVKEREARIKELEKELGF